MSTTEDEESDCNDHDLAAPPRKRLHAQHKAANNPPQLSSTAIDHHDDDDDRIADEEDLVELSSHQYKAAVTTATTATKTSNISADVDTTPSPSRDKYSAIVRRDITNSGEKIQWSDDEALPVSAAHAKRHNLFPVLGTKRKKPPKSSTGVGTGRGRKYIRPTHRPLILADGPNPTSRTDPRPYNPPQPLDFPELDSPDISEKPAFNTTPSAPEQDLLLPSGGTVPAPIAKWLRHYQVEGVDFMYSLWKSGRGGILGDDMGLGKTVQVIAFLTAVFGKRGNSNDKKRMRLARDRNLRYPRVLIICPGGIMSNWEREFSTWGWWHTALYHGPNKSSNLSTASSGRLEVLITTYTTYKQNQEKINIVEWDIVIADECHVIKERKSDVTQQMAEVNSRVRIGLTGTAIQNNYEELWTLLDWTCPGQVGSLSDWTNQVAHPLRVGQSHDANNKQLSRARKIALQLKTNLLPRFLLRRTKQLIADQLPKKTDKVVFCPLTATQREAYENLLECEDVQLIKRRNEPCDCGRKPKLARGQCCFKVNAEGKTIETLIFPYMMYTQKISNHLALIIPRNEDPPDKKMKDKEILEETLPSCRHVLTSREPMLNFADPELCGKWKVCEKLLQHWFRSGDKVLIFSYSVRLLKMLDYLMVRMGYAYCVLEGSMSLEDRTKIVDQFNNDPHMFVFLISTKAGGVGLNIVSANKVVLFDPNWNPAHDLQAQDRAFRIGQRRDVEVFRLISQGTIEEIVYARQIYKQQQANIGYDASNERRYFKGVQGESHGELFGLENIFSFDPDRPFLRGVVNKTSVAEQIIAMAELSFSQQERDMALQLDSVDGVSGIRQFAKISSQMESGDEGEQTGQQQHVDTISAILSEVGVEYTHMNTELIGPSHVEERISEMASAVANDDKKGDLRAYLSSYGVGGNQYKIGYRIVDAKLTLRNVPANVRSRQFQTMATVFGYSSLEAFGLNVEKMNSEERTKLLGVFYRQRREFLEKRGLASRLSTS